MIWSSELSCTPWIINDIYHKGHKTSQNKIVLSGKKGAFNVRIKLEYEDHQLQACQSDVVCWIFYTCRDLPV